MNHKRKPIYMAHRPPSVLRQAAVYAAVSVLAYVVYCLMMIAMGAGG